MTEELQSDALKKLVIFIIALAIMGTLIALAWYFAVELPLQQASLQPPMNWRILIKEQIALPA